MIESVALLWFRLVALSSSQGPQVSHRSHPSLLHLLVRCPDQGQEWMLSPRFFNLCATHHSLLTSQCPNLSTAVSRPRSTVISKKPGMMTMPRVMMPARLVPRSAAVHHPLPRSHQGRRKGHSVQARSLTPGRRKRSVVITARSLVAIGARHRHRHHLHQAVLQAPPAQPSQSLITMRLGRLHPSVNAEIS